MRIEVNLGMRRARRASVENVASCRCDALVAHRAQMGAGETAAGNRGSGRNVAQRLQDERTLMHARVRKRERRKRQATPSI